MDVATFEGLRAKAKSNFEEAKRILRQGDAADPLDKEKVEKLLEDGKKWNADALKLREIEEVMSDMEQVVEGKTGGYRPESSKGFKDWNEFLVAIAEHAVNGKRDERLVHFRERDPEDSKTNRKDMAESVGASGGFLVPPDFQTQVMAVAGETSVVRPRATRIRMARRQVNIPVLDQTGTTTGIPHWFGGLRAYWQEEASLKTQSDPAWRSIELVAHKLIMYTRASDELVDDAAISLQDFLSGPLGFAGAIAWMEDYAFINGTGVGQPLGVINAPATITVNRVDQDNVIYDDLVNMIENFMPSGSGTWVISQSNLSTLLLMNGPTGNPSYIWGNAVNGAPSTLLGYPVIWSEKVPRLSTTSVGDVGLFDFKYYLIGDRLATTVESTKFDRWQYDQTSWRGVHRVDGQPWLSTPLTYQDGTTQVSPFVILGAKST